MCNNEYCTSIGLKVMALDRENDAKIADMKRRGCSDLEIAGVNAAFLEKVIRINAQLLKRCATCKDQNPEITKLSKEAMNTVSEVINVYDTVGAM
jgi:hypothetical protein